ncbi:MAG TPA: hypothetical protein VIJ25_03245, partial [Methylococcales bacterium]
MTEDISVKSRVTLAEKRVAEGYEAPIEPPQPRQAPPEAVGATKPAKATETPIEAKTAPKEAIIEPKTEPLPPPPKTATSIKNETVDIEREQRGLPRAMQPARRDFGTVWDDAMAKVEDNPAIRENLVADLKATPRAITDTEDALLLHKQVELQNEYDRLSQRLVTAMDAKDVATIAETRARIAKTSDDLLDVYNVNKAVGTETGRGLNARKMLVNEDFSLAKMVTRKRVAKNGKALTAQEETQVATMHEKIVSTQKAFDDYVAQTEARLQALESNRPMARPKAVKGEYGGENRIFTKQTYEAAKAKILNTGQFNAGVDPEQLLALIQVGGYHAEALGRDFAKWSSKMVDEFGEKVKPYLASTWSELEKRFNDTPKLAAYKKRLEKSTSEYERRVAQEDFTKQVRRKLELDKEAQKLKIENLKAKNKFTEALQKDEYFKRTRTEKIRDGFLKWYRAGLLSSPITLVKLTSAAAARMVTTPVLEAVGEGLSRVFPA